MVLNGSFSEHSGIESGVPQGSVPGPLIFLIYINDLKRNIKSNTIFFGDDTMLFSVVVDPEISANELNHGIIQKWAYQWKLEFNPDPTKQANEVLFSSIPNPHIVHNETVLAKTNEQKHLGFILYSKLSFEKHLNEKIIKAKNYIGIIKHLSCSLPLKTLDQMFKALVRSHLVYCDIIYHILSKQDQFGVTLNSLMEKVERIQYQAVLAVTGAWQGSNRSKLYDELGWEFLSNRR